MSNDIDYYNAVSTLLKKRPKFISLKVISEKTGLSASTIYKVEARRYKRVPAYELLFNIERSLSELMLKEFDYD